MTIQKLITQLRESPETIDFKDVMSVISQYYTYTPSQFSNGSLVNAAGTNEGSCKLFAFAKLHKLSEIETLSLFGHYYRDDVLGHPAGEDHGNIRNFMAHGWLGIQFNGTALKEK